MTEPVTPVSTQPAANGDDGGNTPSSPSRPARPHFSGLEGMRAVAASLVVLTHATYIAGDARSGWLAQPGRFGDAGVAVFFVLSGFLIYRPFIVAHLDGDRPLPSLAFWWRRLLRIVPCYWVALSTLWAMHRFSPFGFQMGYELGSGWWRYYLLIQIYDPRYGQGGIAQSWSIATEVSFYLLIPFWSMLIRALSRRRATPPILEFGGIAALFTFGFLSRWWFSHYSGLAVGPIPGLLPHGVTWRAVSFTWLPNQIDTFAIGMAVAALHVWATKTGALSKIERWTKWPTLWWIGALGIYGVITYVLGDNSGDYRSTYWQLRAILYGSLGLTMLVPLVFGDQRVGAIRRLVTWKPIWWIGTVSYGFYLWHLSFMERLITMPSASGGPPVWHGFGTWRLFNANVVGLFVGASLLGLAAAGASWYLIEKPLLRFKGAVGGRRALQPDDRPDTSVTV